MQPCTSSRSDGERCQRCLRRDRSSQISSDEPPPMSNTSTQSARSRSARRSRRRRASPPSRGRGSRCRGRSRSRTRSQEVAAVAGDAAGLGGDQPRARTTRAARSCRRRPCSASMVRSMAASDRRPVWRHALAQADDAREGVDDPEAAPRRARDQQAAVVGAEIERAVGGLADLAVGLAVAGVEGRGRRRGRGRHNGCRARLGRCDRLFLPTLDRIGAQFRCDALLLSALHLCLPRPLTALRRRTSFCLKLGAHLAGRPPG